MKVSVFVLIVSAQREISTFSMVPTGPNIAAFAKSTSMPPSKFAALLANSAQPIASVASTAWPNAVILYCCAKLCATSSALEDLPQSAILWPDSARWWHSSRPMPRVPPMITILSAANGLTSYCRDLPTLLQMLQVTDVKQLSAT